MSERMVSLKTGCAITTSSWRLGEHLALFLVLVLCGIPTSAAESRLLLRSSDWTAYAVDQADPRMCFALSRVGDGPSATRVFVSAWPKDGVKAEVSVQLPATLRGARQISASIDGSQFPLALRGDRAFVSDAMVELRLIEAMRKGSQMAIEAAAPSGSIVRETISLKGFGQALQAVALCK